MTDSLTSAQFLLHGVAWHLECMKLASAAIDNFRPAADGFQMRMHYSLYVTNLYSAIDIVGDTYGRKTVEAALAEKLATGEVSGLHVLNYLRELRNAVVHRGLDPTQAGVVHNGIVCAVAPQFVTNLSGKQKYAAPRPLLRDVFLECDSPSKQVLREFLQPQITAVAEASPDMLLADTLGAINAAQHVPEWVKSSAQVHLTAEMLVMMQQTQTSKLEGLFSPWTP